MIGNRLLHIIDSEIRGLGGHNLSFANSIVKEAKGLTIHIWADKTSTLEYSDPNIIVHRYFDKKFRKLQTLFLVSRLLKKEEKLLFSTASSADLYALRIATLWRKIHKHHVYLFFHFVNRTGDRRKQKFYSGIARKLPDLEILAPAKTVCDFFARMGFRNVSEMPYPVYSQEPPSNVDSDFSHLLVSGFLRVDKGAAAIADLIDYMAEIDSEFPVVMQGEKNINKYSEEERLYWGRIVGSDYSYLSILPCALSPEEYRGLFKGAVSLQLYDPEIFQDRASGAALDAFLNGAPAVVLRGSWNARLVEQYGGGLVISSLEPKNILSTVKKIIFDYEKYRKKTLDGGVAIRKKHSSRAILGKIISQ